MFDSPVNAAWPIDADRVLIVTVFFIRIQNYRAPCKVDKKLSYDNCIRFPLILLTFRREAVLVSVAGNARHAFYRKIELRKIVSGAFHENHQKAAETCIDVHRNFVLPGELRDFLDVVHRSVWIVWCGANKLKKES